MNAFLVLLPIVFAVDPQLVVNTLNLFYSEISASDVDLYSLISALHPESTSSLYDEQMVLLLNNTYKGLSLHCFSVNSSDPYPNILSHSVPAYIDDPEAASIISNALLSYLNLSEVSLTNLFIKRQQIAELNIFLYSADVLFNGSEYRIDAIVNGNLTNYYINANKHLEVSEYVVGAESRVKSIIVSMFLGIIVTFVGLCVFFKRNQRLPFTAKDEARSSLNIEHVRNIT